MIRSAGRELKRRLPDTSLGPTFRARDLESFFFKKIILIYSLLAVLGFHCHEGFFSRCGERGLLSSCGAQAPCSGFSRRGAPRLQGPGSVVLERGLTCSTACGIFLQQQCVVPCPGRRTDSLRLNHQERLETFIST